MCGKHVPFSSGETWSHSQGPWPWLLTLPSSEPGPGGGALERLILPLQYTAVPSKCGSHTDLSQQRQYLQVTSVLHNQNITCSWGLLKCFLLNGFWLCFQTAWLKEVKTTKNPLLKGNISNSCSQPCENFLCKDLSYFPKACAKIDYKCHSKYIIEQKKVGKILYLFSSMF